MKIYIKKVPGLKIPSQANPGEDGAYDIVATTPPVIHGTSIERPLDGGKLWSRVAFIEYGTNLYISPKEDSTIQWTAKNENYHRDGADFSARDIAVKFHTELMPRSSVSKMNLVLANSVGLVDNGYRAEIKVRFKYIFQPEDMVLLQEERLRLYGIVNNEYLYQQGDKIIQIKAVENIDIDFEEVDELLESSRGLGGFGSSGR